jgi:hypothetical protein
MRGLLGVTVGAFWETWDGMVMGLGPVGFVE